MYKEFQNVFGDTVEDITSLGISGIYSLLILSLCFNFLLAIRIQKLNKRVLELETYFREQMGRLKESVGLPKEKGE